jgi:imidazolonepropionase-like amidohydrolase
MNPNARAIIAVNPYSAHINVTRNNGITSVLTMPRNGVVVGQSSVINLQGSTANEMTVLANNALVINFPRVTTFGGFSGQPTDFNEAVRTRDRRIEDLKKMFKDAENYGRLQDAYAKDKTLARPKTDLKLAALVSFVRGEKPIMFTAERDRDIKAVIRFADETKTKAVIMGGSEAWKSADLLKQKNVPVIFTNIYSLPTRDDDAYDSLFDVAGKLQKAGVKFCISTGDTGAEARDLPYHAGIASAFGLPKDEALKSVTLYPAQILGVADKMGSIEAGKMANVVVTNGDILEPTTKILHLFINGRKIPLTSRHTELYEQFKDRK